MRESIVIISSDHDLADKLQSEIAPEGILRLETKYYDVSVPVGSISSCTSPISPNVKGIVVIEDNKYHSLSLLPTVGADDDDTVKIYFSRNDKHLDICIDNGYELVTGLGDDSNKSNTETGIGRIVEALKCRIWQTDEPSTCSEESREEKEEDVLNSFESLISQMQQVRIASSTLTDEERRARAECVASQLAKLLCDDDDSDDDDNLTVT